MTIAPAAAADRRSLFREVNLRIRDVAETLGGADGIEYRLLCECGRDECVARIDVPVGVFDTIRVAARRFLVAPGHERSDAEQVLERDGGYAIVSPAV